jgi:DivIVA domain-containing protein
MSSFDLPHEPSGEQIRGREFSPARRGYDPDQVRDYLYSLAERFESMDLELQETRRSMQQAEARASQGATASPEAEPEEDPYEAFGKRVAGVLAAADKEGARILKEAKAEAKQIVEEARSEAAQIRVDADGHADVTKAEAGGLLEQAREEADRTLADLAGRRRVLAGQLEAMQSRLLDAAKTIGAIMEDPDVDTAMPIIEAQGSDAPDAQEQADGSASGTAWASANGSNLPDFSGIEFDLDADEGPTQES